MICTFLFPLLAYFVNLVYHVVSDGKRHRPLKKVLIFAVISKKVSFERKNGRFLAGSAHGRWNFLHILFVSALPFSTVLLNLNRSSSAWLARFTLWARGSPAAYIQNAFCRRGQSFWGWNTLPSRLPHRFCIRYSSAAGWLFPYAGP